MSILDELMDQSAVEIYKAFAAQGEELVYAAKCCGRLYLGVEPAKKCRTCQGTPKHVEVRKAEDLATL